MSGACIFLAEGKQSCKSACAARSDVCDEGRVREMGTSIDSCKAALSSLSVKYAQQLSSSKHGAGRLGCSLHSGENGWAQLMREHRKYPTCEACDGDRKRRRACACIYSSDSSTQEHVCQSSRQDCECLERLWHVLFGEQPVLPLHHIYGNTASVNTSQPEAQRVDAGQASSTHRV